MPVYEWEGIYKFFKYVPMQILCSVNNSYVAYIISGADTFPSFQCLLNCRNWNEGLKFSVQLSQEKLFSLLNEFESLHFVVLFHHVVLIIGTCIYHL